MKNFLILSLLLAFLTTEVCAQWKPAGDKIKTQWANKINTSAVLPEYPRPIMERNEWKNLNGLWEYAITDLGGNVPAHFDGQILVPFAVESSLSGVGQRVGAKKELWYSRSFEVPVAWKNKNVLLHFGAVDWKADIWVNDRPRCDHLVPVRQRAVKVQDDDLVRTCHIFFCLHIFSCISGL